MLSINNKIWDELKARDVVKQLENIEDETFFFELKEDDVSTNKFIEEVSGFANTFGGYIFLGVNDKKCILGCKEWTEQKIHSVMHNNITPTPNFDVKGFKIDKKKIFVVKIEPGIEPPYITNRGKIYERLSSGSFPITDSNKLTQIYYKRENELKNIEKKISIEPLDYKSDTFPNNLCAYIDFGFSPIFSEPTKVWKSFPNFNLSPICDYLNTLGNKHSISRQGTSIVISIGDVKQTKGNLVGGLQDFIEIMLDGSVRGRILLVSDIGSETLRTNIVRIPIVAYWYEDIYKMLIDNSHLKSFISAYRYEQLVVAKQFIPYIQDNNLTGEKDYYRRNDIYHADKYGGNIIITGSRYPATGLSIVDKALLDRNDIPYTYDNIIEQLFPRYFITLGYIEQLKVDN